MAFTISRPKFLAAVLGAALSLSLAACSNTGSDANSSGDSSPSQAESIAPPEVDRDPTGELPEISFADGVPSMQTVEADPPDTVTVKTLKEGDGEPVASGDFVSVNYAGFLWSDGTQFDSSYESETAANFSLDSVIPGWKYGLEGAKVGDQVLLVVPPEYGYGDTENGPIPAGSTLVFVVDILSATSPTTDALTEATATNAELPAGLEVTGDLGAEPSISYEEGSTAPAEAQVIVLSEGKGDVIADTDTILYHGVGGYWGEESTSTWPDAYQQVGSGGGVEIVGQHVGSRILLVYPKDEEAGTEASVMVIDVMEAVPSA
ncbi:FKBP-type peptidyl-prolyl cis-trans isomerase [Actinomycetaceae bacterium L2_0104]